MPTVLTEPVAKAIVDAVRQGVPLKTACQAAGIDRSAVYKLLERAETGEQITPEQAAFGKQLARDLEQARATWEQELVRQVQQTATDYEHRDSFKAKVFMLTHFPSTRQTYREERRSIVEHQSDPTTARVHTTVHELPYDELLALGSALADESADRDAMIVDGLD